MSKADIHDEIFGGSDSELEDVAEQLESDDEREPPPELAGEGEDQGSDDDYTPVQLPSFKKKATRQVELPEELKRRPPKKKRVSSRRARRNSGSEGRRGGAEGGSDGEAARKERSLSPSERKRQEAANDVEEAYQRTRTKRVKNNLPDEGEMDEYMVKMIKDMKDAAFTDLELHNAKRPAVAKLQMLPKVMAQLNREQLFDQWLENNVLEGMKLWLEPLPDASLPSMDIQVQLFGVLERMPIKTGHLRDSLIGRIVNFYSKCSRITPDVQKIAAQLVERWLRPVLNRSSNYRDSSIPTASLDDGLATRRPRPVSTGRPGGNPERAVAAESQYSNRARIPFRVAASFDVLPASRVSHMSEYNEKKMTSDQFKRMQLRMKTMKTANAKK
ncbi:hypothetical protein DFS34DRAFT_311439 [Phlyctochytrium arcticum]|nr:hypothetical protein DFS34DRAFT_311439 [Phlyctochytrium arcticum]